MVGLFFNNIETNGVTDQLNVFFGGLEPLVAFAAVTCLPSVDTNFYGMPEFSSPMVFEMFSVDDDSNNTYLVLRSSMYASFSPKEQTLRHSSSLIHCLAVGEVRRI